LIPARPTSSGNDHFRGRKAVKTAREEGTRAVVGQPTLR
jgi:hypothetical protein